MHLVRLYTYTVLHQPFVHRPAATLGEVQAVSQARALSIARRRWGRNLSKAAIKVRRKPIAPLITNTLRI